MPLYNVVANIQVQADDERAAASVARLMLMDAPAADTLGELIDWKVPVKLVEKIGD